MYPPVFPHDQGMLEVSGSHQVHWEVSGNPDGIPALYLHGGPGGVLRPGYRRRFDPDRYRIIGVQQRGAGASRPHVTDAAHRLDQNTTQHLLDDLEAVRDHLGVERWLVSGVSWGATLALHHALHSPSAVAGLVLVAVTTTSPTEVDWITEGVQYVYPEAWDQLARFVEGHSSWRRGHGRLIDAVAEIMAGDDLPLRAAMAAAWMTWEDTHIQVGIPVEHLAPAGTNRRPVSEEIAMTTLVSHYWSSHARLDPQWVPSGGLIDNLAPLRGLPICMIHGRRDISGPVSTPWAIKRVLPGADLHVVEAEGHGGEQMMGLWRRATDSFAATGDFSEVVVTP